jgi:glycopeptide antibiotics resistance protein
MKIKFSLLKYLLPAILWAIFILVLTTTSNGGFVTHRLLGIPTDLLGHAFVFSILVFFIMQGLIKYWRFSFFLRKIQLYGLLYGFLYGVFIEFIQYYFTINRTADYADIIANGVGCMVGLVLFKSVYNDLKFLDKE